MRKRYRHPQLGEFHKLDLTASHSVVTMISDAQLAGLVRYLNESGTQKEGERIVHILEDMQALERLEEPLWGDTEEETAFSTGPNARAMFVMRKGMSVPHPLLRKISPEKYRRQLEIEKRRYAINQELNRNHFYTHVWPSKDGKWRVFWQIQSRAPKRYHVIDGVLEIDDGVALQMILDFAKVGYLNRLRRCTCCNNWLYAKFRHQDFCSTKCQQKHYAISPEWKAKRRDYMRRYRNM
jgi:hypothetical protein